VPADADALASRPADYSFANSINRPGDFMPRHTRVLNARPKALLHQRITVTNAARSDFDPNRS
jgi:hypothetical protein